ncbi:MAG: hypothetical protein QME92_04655 [Bacillota bacterium]|nr:hypothetical protein [Bacillota bacterium]
MSRFVALLKKQPFTLVASLPTNDCDLAKAALDGGAEVIKVHINVHHRASGTLFGSLDEERDRLTGILEVCGGRAPVGIVPGGSPVVEALLVETLRDMGFDFISAYAHHLSPDCLDVDGIGKMVAAHFSYTAGDVATLAAMGFDVFEASVMHPETYGQRMSLKDLAAYKHICDTVSQPVVIPTQCAVRPEEVRQLAAAGARAIMVGAVVTGKTRESICDSIRAFRRAISALS